MAKVLSTTTCAPVRRLDDGGDVDLVEQRVGRRLDPDQPRLGAQGGAQGVEVALVDEVVGEPEAGEDLVHEPVGAAVEVERQDQVVARAERAAVSTAWVAAMPLENAAPCPPSSSPSARSSAARVGFAERE